MAASAEPSSNSLGLELEALKISDAPEQSQTTEAAPATEPVAETSEAPQPTEQSNGDAEGASDSPTGDEAKSDGKKAETKEKKKPYVNPERVKTGGPQREKLTEDELAERMARIREQNEKIKQRRIDVQADEDAFKKTQQADKARMARTKKVQENVDRTREQNARRKMEKVQNREWDTGKKSVDWKLNKPAGDEGGEPAEHSTFEVRSAVRGRGRGRPGDRNIPSRDNNEKPTTDDNEVPSGDGPSADDKPVETAPPTTATAA